MRRSSILSMLRAELGRSLIIALRYPVESVSSLLLSAFVFLGIFFGAQQLGVTSVGSGYSLDGMVISYFAWLLLSSAVGQPSSDVESEAARGSILGLYTSTYGLGVVLACRAVASTLINVVFSMAVLVALVVITGADVQWAPSAVLPLILLFISGLGFGFVLAAVTLRLKRTQVLFAPVYLLLLPLTFLSVDGYDALARSLFLALPGTPSATMLRLQMTGGALDPELLIVAALNAVFYVAVGAVAIRTSIRKTAALGVAGHA